MRIALSLLVLLTAACSTTVCRRCADADARTATVFIDTDTDGLPDARVESRDPDARQTGLVFFVDTDEDGLPDSRHREVIVYVDGDGDGLPDSRRVRVHSGLTHVRNEHGRETRIDRALESLERAIAEVRRAMR